MNQDFEPTSFDPQQAPAATARGPLPVLARWLARLGLGGRRAGVDDQTGLLHRSALLERGEQLLACTRWRGQDATLLLLDFRDLLEVRGIYGESASAALVDQLVQALRRLAGRHGLAGRTGPAQFAVLLPGHTRAAAVSQMHAVLGKPCRLEHDTPDDELVVVPDVAVDACGSEGLPALYERLAITLARHHSHEERRRSHLRRERERHSRPAPLDDALPVH